MGADYSNYTEFQQDLLLDGIPADQLYRYDNPNYINPASRAGPILAIIIGLLITTWTVVPIRIYLRCKVLKSFGLDDWLIIPATLMATILSAFNIALVHYGWGRHIWDIPPTNTEAIWKYNFFANVTFNLAIAVTKMSICCFYLRFAFDKWLRVCTYMMLGWNAVIGTTYFLLALFLCRPINSNWRMDITGKCFDPKVVDVLLLSHPLQNFVGDVVLLLLPIPILVQMMLPIRQKLALIGVFMVGTFGTITVLIRSILMHYYVRGVMWDASWHGAVLPVLLVIEIHVAIFCTSVPVLKPLFVKVAVYMSGMDIDKTKDGAGASYKPSGVSLISDDTLRNNNLRPLVVSDRHDSVDHGKKQLSNINVAGL